MVGASAPSSESETSAEAVPARADEVAQIARVGKILAAAIVLSAVVDAAIGLDAVGTATVVGPFLLGVGVTQCYVAYGLWHCQRWGVSGAIAVQPLAIVPLAVLGHLVVLAPKLAIVGYLVLRRDAEWQ